MAGEKKRALRKAWFQVHKWIGLILMIVLIPLSLTGSVLVWDEPLDHALNPQRYDVSGPKTLPPSAYVTAALRRLPAGSLVAAIRYPHGSGPIMLSAAPAKAGPRRPGPPPRTNVWLDPPSARVLDVASSSAGVIRWAHVFHGSLMVPGMGRAIVGWLGVAMFLSCATGLWLWWPAAGRLVRGLRWQRGDRRLDTNLHHLIGFWIVLPLAMLSFTGVWIAWPQMVGAGQQGGGPRRFAPPVAARLDADAALAAAQAFAPGAPVAINWPTADGGWRISLSGAAAQVADVIVSDTSGAATAAPKDDRARGGLAATIRRWHDGTGMGPVWQLLIVLAGIAPTILGITAITMWLRSRRWRKSPGKLQPRETLAA